MRTSKYGEIILDQDDLVDMIFRGRDVLTMQDLVVDLDVDITTLNQTLDDPGHTASWTRPESRDITIQEWDRQRQACWFMPREYAELDIAQHVLSLCRDDVELQRAGQELLMYQERDMMDVLRYMHYLVTVMRQHGVIWGVGRGSSVASFVLYLLGVHRINSIEYDLDPGEFLR